MSHPLLWYIAGTLIGLASPAARTVRHVGERLATSFFRDRLLYRFAAIHTMSFGFSVIVGNWVVTLLEHHGHAKTTASNCAFSPPSH